MDKLTQTPKSKSHKKLLILAITGWALLVLIIALFAAGIYFKKASIVINKNANQSVVLATNVCGKDIISKYNSVLNSGNADDYASSFKTLVDEINLLPNHDDDANCSFMLFNYYLYNGDATKAGEYIDKLKVQNSQGNYLSGDIKEIDSIYSIEYKLQIFKDSGIKLDMFDTNGAG